MRFKRRRRRTGTWLPNIGSQFSILNSQTIGEQPSFIVFNADFQVGPNAPVGNNVLSFPLVVDSPDSTEGEPSTSIGDYQLQTLGKEESFGYLLQRIVGTCMLFQTESAGTFVPAVTAVTAGIMVRRVNQELPELPAVNAADADPQVLQNIQDPWLWRRTWLFSPNDGATGAVGTPPRASGDGFGDFRERCPNSNILTTGLYGTNTMDVKSKRVIKKEERLFMTISARAQGFQPDSEVELHCFLGGVIDYRCYGKIITTQGNRRNAVR